MNVAQIMFPEDAALLKRKKRAKGQEESSLRMTVEAEGEKMVEHMEGIKEELKEIAKNKNDKKLLEQISQLGDKISNQIANSCSEIIRKMNQIYELQEWNQIHMLQEQIMDLKDQLIQEGVFEEVYKDIQTCKIPSINMTDEEMKIVMAIFAYNPKGYEQFKQKIYQTCCHPMEALKGKTVKFYRGEIPYFIPNDSRRYFHTIYYMEICGCGSRIEVDFNDLKIETKSQGKEEDGKKAILCCNGREYILDIPYSFYHNSFFWLCYSSIIKLKMDDNLSEEVFRYWAQKNGDMTENQWDFESFLESLNRKIELENLRHLWLDIREAVGKYKMKLN